MAYGGIAQLARACGSYPQCPRFKSRCRYQAKAQRFTLRLLYGPLVKWLRHRPFTAVTWVRVPYGSPRRSKVRSAQNPAALLELPDSSSALPCSSFPNRTHFVGLRFGCFFALKIGRVFQNKSVHQRWADLFCLLEIVGAELNKKVKFAHIGCSSGEGRGILVSTNRKLWR